MCLSAGMKQFRKGYGEEETIVVDGLFHCPRVIAEPFNQTSKWGQVRYRLGRGAASESLELTL